MARQARQVAGRKSAAPAHGCGAMIARRRLLAVAGGTAAAAGARGALAGTNEPLDIAYVNARVRTGAGPDTRTDAIGITGERIAAIGADAVRARIGKRTQRWEEQTSELQSLMRTS